jgi:Protein of unknown function (DUF1194)
MRTLFSFRGVVLAVAGLVLVAMMLRAPTAAQTWAQAPVDVDLELVLTVDISMSMDPEEQRLQRDGYIEAFRDPNIIAAIRAGYRKKIAVAYVEWAGPTTPATIIPWRLIDSRETAEAFVAELAQQPYRRLSRTSISAALVNNSGPLMSVVRPQVLSTGVVINGLPILVKPTLTWTSWDAPDLDLYYANCVIGGPGSFSIPILKNSDFIGATRQKILLEIANIQPPARIIPAQQSSRDEPYDCNLVEQRLQSGGGYRD